MLLSFCVLAFLYNAIRINKSKKQTEKITAVENDELFNHLFLNIPVKSSRNKKLKIIKL